MRAPAFAPTRIRAAAAADLPALEALLAPAIAAGDILPTQPDTRRFLVAECGGAVLGAVALTPWTNGVVELGSLVSGLRGVGLGSALVAAALDEAAVRGAHTVVALTGLADWFGRRGFARAPVAPWELVHAPERPAAPGPVDARALSHKAHDSCRLCPRHAACGQVLLAKRVLAVSQEVAA